MIFEMLSRVYGVPKQVGVEVKKIFLILAEKNKMRSPQTLPHGGGGVLFEGGGNNLEKISFIASAFCVYFTGCHGCGNYCCVVIYIHASI
jgi:hypothetical protein